MVLHWVARSRAGTRTGSARAASTGALPRGLTARAHPEPKGDRGARCSTSGSRAISAAPTRSTHPNRSCAWPGSYRAVIAVMLVITGVTTERAQEGRLPRRPSVLFLPTTLASCEIGCDYPGTAVSGEAAERNADSDPAEAGAKHHGPVARASEPLTHHPLRGQSRGPGEVFAEDGATRALGERPAGHRAVREVLAAQHVRGVA